MMAPHHKKMLLGQVHRVAQTLTDGTPGGGVGRRSVRRHKRRTHTKQKKRKGAGFR